jgi:hypothetical protein
MTSTKYIGMDVRKDKYFDRGHECCREDRDGMRDRNQSQHDSAVYRWAARRLAGHV